MKEKRMLKRMALAGLVALFTVGFAAQDALAQAGRNNQRGPVDPELRVARLRVILDLTEGQEKAIYALMLKEDEEIRAVHEKYRNSRRQDRERVRAEIQAIHDRYALEIEKHLTAAQVEKYREYRKQMAERRDSRRANREGRGPGDGQGRGPGDGQGRGRN